jgi:hypothetical protein
MVFKSCSNFIAMKIIIHLIFLSGLVSASLFARSQEWARDGSQQDCDTLLYPLPGTYTLYRVTGDEYGYVSGNNSTQDKAKANLYYEYPAGKEIRGVLFDFAVARNLSGTNPDIVFAIWDNTGDQASPGAMKASVTLPLSQIIQDVANQQLTYVGFDTPVPITDHFYAGVILPVTTGDTLAMWTNRNGDVPAGVAWEQWSTGTWIHFYFRWQLSIAHAIHPVVCNPSNGLDETWALSDIVLYPNPVTSSINVCFPETLKQQAHINIYNSMGVLIEARIIDPGSQPIVRFMLDRYPKGLYFVCIEAGRHRISKKIQVI